MDIALIIISSLTLIVVSFFLYLYMSNEKKNKEDREIDLTDLKGLLTDTGTKIQETTNKQGEKFEELRKEIKLAQDQAFKEYSQKVQDVVTKYSEDSHQSKLEANRLKEQMQIELRNILTEIKAPLDLD